MQVQFHRPFISHAKKENFLPFHGERKVSIFCLAYKSLNSKILNLNLTYGMIFGISYSHKTTKLVLYFVTEIPHNSVILLPECLSHTLQNYCGVTVQIQNKLAISALLEVTRQGQD